MTLNCYDMQLYSDLFSNSAVEQPPELDFKIFYHLSTPFNFLS